MRSHGFITFWLLAGFVVLAPLIVLVTSYVIVQNNRQHFIEKPEIVAASLQEEPRTAIVFGSGLYPSGVPRPVLAARLQAAAELYQAGAVDKVVVSGHVEPFYDEPRAMQEYLFAQGVPERAVTLDTEGDSTYATCDQAKHVYDVDEAVLVTQASHLSRAIYLCRSQDMVAYGFVAETESTHASQLFQWFREAGGNVRAVFDVLTDGRSRYN